MPGVEFAVGKGNRRCWLTSASRSARAAFGDRKAAASTVTHSPPIKQSKANHTP